VEGQLLRFQILFELDQIFQSSERLIPAHHRQFALRKPGHEPRKASDNPSLERIKNDTGRSADERSDIWRQCVDRSCLRQALKRGVERGELRDSAILNSPQVVIAPMALVDLWLMMFGDRQPLDLKAYFDAHLDLVLNGLVVK